MWRRPASSWLLRLGRRCCCVMCWSSQRKMIVFWTISSPVQSQHSMSWESISWPPVTCRSFSTSVQHGSTNHKSNKALPSTKTPVILQIWLNEISYISWATVFKGNWREGKYEEHVDVKKISFCWHSFSRNKLIHVLVLSSLFGVK